MYQFKTVIWERQVTEVTIWHLCVRLCMNTRAYASFISEYNVSGRITKLKFRNTLQAVRRIVRYVIHHITAIHCGITQRFKRATKTKEREKLNDKVRKTPNRKRHNDVEVCLMVAVRQANHYLTGCFLSVVTLGYWLTALNNINILRENKIKEPSPVARHGFGNPLATFALRLIAVKIINQLQYASHDDLRL